MLAGREGGPATSAVALAAVPLSQQGGRGTWEMVLCPWELQSSHTDFTGVFGHWSENAFKKQMRRDCHHWVMVAHEKQAMD